MLNGLAEIGDNSGVNGRFRVPADEQQAVEFVLARLQKLTNERRTHSEIISDVKKEARSDHKIETRELNLSVRLSKMGPERREKWFNETFSGAKMFGIKLDWSDDDAPDAVRTKYINRIIELERDKKSIADDIRETYSVAKESGLHVPALKQLLAMRAMNERGDGDNDAEDFFIALDSYGSKVGLW